MYHRHMASVSRSVPHPLKSSKRRRRHPTGKALGMFGFLIRPQCGWRGRARDRSRGCHSGRPTSSTFSPSNWATSPTLGLAKSLCCQRFHSSRLAFLVDATVAKSVLNEGCTSVPTLRKAVAQPAMASLAGDARARYAHIPSEDKHSSTERKTRKRPSCSEVSLEKLRHAFSAHGCWSSSSQYWGLWSRRNT